MYLYLGKDTFAPGALNMAKKGSKIAAVPVDGWTQMVVYRKDLFENAELAPPTSYANIVAAVEKLSKQNGMFGFVAATKTDENFMKFSSVLVAATNPNIPFCFESFSTAATIFA